MTRIVDIAKRECRILVHNPIYLFCMVLFPMVVVMFFTSLMNEGVPTELPVGVVDMDNSATTRKLVRKLDAFETSKVVAHYPTVTEARKAIQRGEVYAYIYFPKGTTSKLIAGRQPKISFYYSNASVTSGSLLFRDLKTISTLGSAGVGAAKLSALGKTEKEIQTFLQPIVIDLHPINNPEISYNVYLTTSLVPACLMLFIFLISAYSIGTELKFGTSKKWMEMADGNVWIALIGKFVPQMVVFVVVLCGYFWYIFEALGFPHAGGMTSIMLLAVLSVLAAQGFGIFAFGLMPSLRMSMSICSLWAALSFSVMGATYPLAAMDGAIQALAQLFPMRHYFMIYQTCVFNGFPVAYAWTHVMALVIFAGLPVFVGWRIKKAMEEWVYIP